MCMEVSTAAGARSVWLLDYKAGMEQGIVQVGASEKQKQKQHSSEQKQHNR